MSDQLLTILKFALLAVIYLFFFRVLRAVWAEISPPEVAVPDPRAAAAPAAPPAGKARREAKAKTKGRKRMATQLLIIEPAQLRGHAYPLAPQLTVGRSASCQITIDDTFVSQVHARITHHDDQVTIEDLGSTNGTFVNGQRPAGPVSLRIGDRIQFGNTVLELA